MGSNRKSMRFVLFPRALSLPMFFRCLLRRSTVVLAAFLVLALSACEDAERFTVNTGAVLRSSSDTVRFDTVLTTVPSSTRMLTVYNPNKNGLRIQRVWMERLKDSPYQVNVDGVALSPAQEAYDFEVRGGDSLMVFAKVLLPEAGQDEPRPDNDRLMIQLESGVVQSVVLTATAQDAYMWRGKKVLADTTLRSGRPFVIYDSLVVASGVTLTLERGVQLYFHDKASLLVRGRLDVRGLRDSMVVFRGDRTDRLFDYLPYDNTPSRWGGIRLFAESTGNRFYGADIHSATFGIACDSSSVDEEKLRLENSVLHNIGGDGLSVLGNQVRVANTQISNTLGHCVSVVGGDVEFLHCTLAQFYPWDAMRGKALYLANQRFNVPYPLLKAHFLNCIITGYSDDVIQGSIDDEENSVDYLFDHCLLNTVKSDDAKRFVGVVYEADEKDQDTCAREKNFVLFDTQNFLYDFRLDSCSVARNIGDMKWALQVPDDPYGVSRVTDEGPDAGCYEYVPRSEPKE